MVSQGAIFLGRVFGYPKAFTSGLRSLWSRTLESHDFSEGSMAEVS